jgi:hypothetical protein
MLDEQGRPDTGPVSVSVTGGSADCTDPQLVRHTDGFGLAWLAADAAGEHSLMVTVLGPDLTRAELARRGGSPQPAPDHRVSEAGSDVRAFRLVWNGRVFRLAWTEARGGRLRSLQTSLAVPREPGPPGYDEPYRYPSSALLRATLLNGARRPGAGAAPVCGPGPHDGYGWGHLDLRAALLPAEPATFFARDDGVVGPGRTVRYGFTLPSGTRSVRAMLVWTDPPGPRLVNRLRLLLRTPGAANTYAGNRWLPVGGHSAPTSKGAPPDDDTAPDPVQQIVLEDPSGLPSGDYEISVTADAFGVPDGAELPRQPFAVVVAAGGAAPPARRQQPPGYVWDSVPIHHVGIQPTVVAIVASDGAVERVDLLGPLSGLHHRPLAPVGATGEQLVSTLVTEGRLVLIGDELPVAGDLEYHAVGELEVAASPTHVMSGGSVGRFVRPDRHGTVRTETVLVNSGQPPEQFLDMTVELVGDGTQLAAARYRLELATVAGFITLVEQAESAWSGHDRTAFLSALRRLYYGRDAVPPSPLFDSLLLRRYPTTPPVARRGSTLHARLAAMKEAWDGVDALDLGHVLVAVEASPRQAPEPRLMSPDLGLLIASWGGDLASVLEAYVLATVAGRLPDGPAAPGDARRTWPVEEWIPRLAGRADLLGDLDGVVIGAAYDPGLDLSANLRAHYERVPRDRYAAFLAVTRDPATPDGPTPLGVEQVGNAIRLTAPGRRFIAETVSGIAGILLAKQKGVDQEKSMAIIRSDSPQVEAVAGHFVEFLERGLSWEAT